MKRVFKPAIPSAAVKMVILMGIAVLLSQCNLRELLYSKSRQRALQADYISYMNGALADNLKGRQDGYIRVMRTLANIMADYENMPAGERRGRYDYMLSAALNSEPEIAALYTVWKPNAVDGMDSRHIGRPGSGPSGQYAASFTKDDDQARMETVAHTDIETAMIYLNGSDSKKDFVEDPVPGQLNGRDTYLIRMSVPIVNRRTNETTGIVGCLLSIDPVQTFLEQAIMDNSEVAAMAVYSNNGFIMGSYVPDRIGKNISEVDTIYGDYIKEAEQAVHRGMNFSCLSYSPVLRTNISIFMTSIRIGNSDTTWTVMIAATEEYFKRMY